MTHLFLSGRTAGTRFRIHAACAETGEIPNAIRPPAIVKLKQFRTGFLRMRAAVSGGPPESRPV